MDFKFRRFALVLVSCVTAVTLSTAISPAQRTKASTIPPASPQAKTSQPATHFTQGTIASIDANQLVITKKVRGKAQQVTFAINPDTQRSGNLATGSRVSVQYREIDRRNIAAAVRELAAESAAERSKPASKPRPKS
ncbi:MAG TPA: hypothetical protein VFU37_19005 [Pyrinomonadaceae bacterium]|nr:hypothetical protein [Pyrinomonadaceae bacterium]